jgi:hypothetical protein
MGQVTPAVVARSRLTVPRGATPDRRCRLTAATNQQTPSYGYGNSVPLLAKSSYVRESIPTAGTATFREPRLHPLARSAAPVHSSYVRPMNQHLLRAVSSLVLRNLRLSSALLIYIGTARRTVISLNERSITKSQDRRGRNRKQELAAVDARALGLASAGQAARQRGVVGRPNRQCIDMLLNSTLYANAEALRSFANQADLKLSGEDGRGMTELALRTECIGRLIGPHGCCRPSNSSISSSATFGARVSRLRPYQPFVNRESALDIGRRNGGGG